MGRYISVGIAYQYIFEKKRIEYQYQSRLWNSISFPEVRNEIIGQMFPDIYKCAEDDDYVYFALADHIKVSDFLSVIKAFYSLPASGRFDVEEYESVAGLLDGKTLEEAYEIAQGKESWLFQSVKLGYYGHYYAYPLTIKGENFFSAAYVSTIMFNMSSAKTITEDDLLSYDFFTELLRYRMRPEKLANAMLVFLTP